MKAIPFTLLLALFSQGLLAQNLINRQFSHYLNQEDVAHVHMTGKMFEMAAYIDTEEATEDAKELQAFLTSIQDFEMVVKPGLVSSQSVYDEAVRKVEPSLEQLMSLREEENEVQFFIDEKDGIVNELVFLVKDQDKFLLGTLTGEMELRHIAKLSQHLMTESSATLTKLKEVGLDELKLYPNPIFAGSTLTIEVPESLLGGKATLYGLQGETLRKVDLNQANTQISMEGLSTGVYLLELAKEDLSIKRRVSVR